MHETVIDRRVSHGVTLAALGVVFGDIGTSPLYAVDLLFQERRGLAPEKIYGGISLVVWSLIVVVAINFAWLALKADNDGEGGVLALYGLLDKVNRKGRSVLAWALLLGAGLLLGDGMITPAISVLSAMEGLHVVAPALSSIVIPMTLVVLAGLFLVQHRGTGTMGKFFGPVMLVWFIGLAILGAHQIMLYPAIWRALSPVWGWRVLVGSSPFEALRMLGAVMLVVTGCEAMYTDMGHFGASAIRRAWFILAFPALLLNYLGQGAWLLGAHEVQGSVFFHMVPAFLALPGLLLATMATVIASQALISGTFSLITQAIELGFFPQLRVRHTERDRHGEVYVPLINWVLLAGCVMLVLGFRSSNALGAAYGLAVAGVMLVTCVALFTLARRIWHWSTLTATLVVMPLIAVNGLFLMANSLKILSGGYVPLGIGSLLFALMLVWNWGRSRILAAYMSGRTMSMAEILDQHRHATYYVDRTAVLMVPPHLRVRAHQRAPLLVQLLWERHGTLPRNIVFVQVVHPRQPYVHDHRFETHVLEQSEHGSIVAVEMRFGFMENPDVESALEQLARETRVPLEANHRKWIVLAVRENLIHVRKAHGAGSGWLIGAMLTLRFQTFKLLRLISEPTYHHYGLGDDTPLVVEMIPVRLP